MTTRDKLEYQKKLRFLRESRAKTASEQLKLAKRAEESDLTKRMVTLGDKENRVPARGETPKEYNETPKTGEESLYKEPVEGGDKKEKKIVLDLDLMDVVQLKEAKGWYVFKVSEGPNDEPYDGLGLEMLDMEPQYYADKREAEAVADMLIDAEDEDFDVARVGSLMMEATPPQEDADQSLLRFKKRKKAVRTKSMKKKSHAKLDESNLAAVLRECGCQTESPFDAPEDEPQGYMLKQSLEKIGSQATDLSNLANHDDDPEPWVEFKVTSAAEQIDAVHDYIKYGRKHRSDMSGHEDMHQHMFDEEETMNENILRLAIRKIILEQAARIPINLATGEPAPLTTPVPSPAATPTPARRPGASAAFRASAINPRSADAAGLISYIFDPRQYAGSNASFSRLARLLQRNDEEQIPRALQFSAGAASTFNARIARLRELLAGNTAALSVLDEAASTLRGVSALRIPANISEIPPNSAQRRSLATRLSSVSSGLAALLPRLQALVTTPSGTDTTTATRPSVPQSTSASSSPTTSAPARAPSTTSGGSGAGLKADDTGSAATPAPAPAPASDSDLRRSPWTAPLTDPLVAAGLGGPLGVGRLLRRGFGL